MLSEEKSYFDGNKIQIKKLFNIPLTEYFKMILEIGCRFQNSLPLPALSIPKENSEV